MSARNSYPATRATAAPDGFVLRRATLADLLDVAALEEECYGDPWSPRSFDVLPDDPQVYFAVVRDRVERRLTGYVVAWYVLDEGELANLAVAPHARGLGVGRALLDAALADAEARRASVIHLEVRESNLAARKLYESCRFQEVGRRRGYYRGPREDALILRRTIAKRLK